MEVRARRLAGFIRQPYLLASIALHAALAAGVYYFGSYQVQLRSDAVQVAASARVTAQARTARRLEDLQKIKELMEQSARREPGPDAPAAPPPPVPSDPREQLIRARALVKDIDEISRDIKAQEQARVTGMSKEEARAELDADMAAPPASTNPADEIAALEERARELLAQRAQDLRRKQEGVAVSTGDNASGRTTSPSADGGGEGHGQAQPGQEGPDGLDAGALAARHIDDFLGQGVDPARAPRQRSSVGRLINHGHGHIPHVGTGGVVKGQGRMLGAGGQYAGRIYLDSWYLIGPFPGRRGSASTPAYPPEQAVLLDAVYRGKDQRLLKWEYVHGAAYPLIPREPVEDAVYYGYTEVLMDQERDLMVWVGVDDDATVYLNDRVMWQSDDTNKGWFFTSVYRNRQGYDRNFNRTERRMLVRFKKGRNKLFFKLWNDTNEMFFSMVLTLPARPDGAVTPR